MNEVVKKKRVVIVQPCIMPYRVPFFNQLQNRLEQFGIELFVFAGAPLVGSERYDVREEVFCCRSVKNRYVRGIAAPVWQKGILSKVKGADLIIAPQVNAFLPSYFWLFNAKQRFAWWGHGEKFQKVGREPVRSWWRKKAACWSNWWFAYNNKVLDIVRGYGYPAEKITSVQNSTDTSSLIKVCKESAGKIKQNFKCLFGESYAQQPVGLFCSRFNAEKNLPFLLDSVERIKVVLPEFKMVIIGGGPDQNLVDLFCSKNAWCKWVGPVVGDDRAQYFSLADVWLSPGATGLQVNDSFGAGVPLITMESELHGPEISYIKSGENGMVVTGDISAYCDTVVDLLSDRELLARLKEGAKKSASKYSIEKMVDNFTDGVVRALKLPAVD